MKSRLQAGVGLYIAALVNRSLLLVLAISHGLVAMATTMAMKQHSPETTCAI